MVPIVIFIFGASSFKQMVKLKKIPDLVGLVQRYVYRTDSCGIGRFIVGKKIFWESLLTTIATFQISTLSFHFILNINRGLCTRLA